MHAFPITGAAEGVAARLGVALLLAVVALTAHPAGAEMFRCVGADGRVTFTDSKSSCENARPHEVRSRIQRVVRDSEESAPPAAAPVQPDTPSEFEMRAARKQWQQKKRAAERELAHVVERAEKLERYVTACNRGLDVYTRDETGIKYRASCHDIRQEHADSRERTAELREYLATGLAADCRKSGCLPGWIR